jgi:hypothetical protein
MIPTLTAIVPAAGAGGQTVTLTGTNLGKVSSVTFDKIAAPFTVVSDTEIKTAVPGYAKTGLVTVSTPAENVPGASEQKATISFIVTK